MTILRWLLLIPAAVLGWYVGVLVAITVYEVGDGFCPAAQVVSGMCHASWFGVFSDVALVLGSSVCGALVVLFPTLMAPYGRIRVAWMAYVCGLLGSAYFLLEGLWLPVLVAASAGAVMVWVIHKRCTPPASQEAI